MAVVVGAAQVVVLAGAGTLVVVDGTGEEGPVKAQGVHRGLFDFHHLRFNRHLTRRDVEFLEDLLDAVLVVGRVVDDKFAGLGIVHDAGTWREGDAHRLEDGCDIDKGVACIFVIVVVVIVIVVIIVVVIVADGRLLEFLHTSLVTLGVKHASFDVVELGFQLIHRVGQQDSE